MDHDIQQARRRKKTASSPWWQRQAASSRSLSSSPSLLTIVILVSVCLLMTSTLADALVQSTNRKATRSHHRKSKTNPALYVQPALEPSAQGSQAPGCPTIHLPAGRVVDCAPPDVVVKLYAQMRAIHDIFTKHNITYWALGGTLVGAVRHQGIIPWDDDNDIAVPVEQEQAMLALAPEFAKLDLEFFNWPDLGYKLQGIKDKVIPKVRHKFPFTDIFMNKFTADGVSEFPVCKANTNWDCWASVALRQDEVSPLKLAQFGDFQIYIPGKSNEYLDRTYSQPLWSKFALAGKSHEKFTDDSKAPVPLNLLPSGPAKPFR